MERDGKRKVRSLQGWSLVDGRGQRLGGMERGYCSGWGVGRAGLRSGSPSPAQWEEAKVTAVGGGVPSKEKMGGARRAVVPTIKGGSGGAGREMAPPCLNGCRAYIFPGSQQEDGLPGLQCLSSTAPTPSQLSSPACWYPAPLQRLDLPPKGCAVQEEAGDAVLGKALLPLGKEEDSRPSAGPGSPPPPMIPPPSASP